FLQNLQSRNHQLAGGREDDRAVEFDRRIVVAAARPRRAKIICKLPMPRVASESVNVHAPMPSDLNRDVRRRAESLNAQTFAGRLAGNPRQSKRSKADDARA